MSFLDLARQRLSTRPEMSGGSVAPPGPRVLPAFASRSSIAEHVAPALHAAVDEIGALWDRLPAPAANRPWLDPKVEEQLDHAIQERFRAQDLPGALAAIDAWRLVWLELLREGTQQTDQGPVSCRDHPRWRSIHGLTICVTCHPPSTPGLVAEWLPAPREDCRG